MDLEWTIDVRSRLRLARNLAVGAGALGALVAASLHAGTFASHVTRARVKQTDTMVRFLCNY